MPFGIFLGYERGEDGQPVIVEKEARVVRLIADRLSKRHIDLWSVLEGSVKLC